MVLPLRPFFAIHSTENGEFDLKHHDLSCLTALGVCLAGQKPCFLTVEEKQLEYLNSLPIQHCLFCNFA